METLFVFTLAVMVAAATPGPSFFALIAGEITLLILAVLGLVALAAQMGELFFAIRLLGAANLFYLEWKLWWIAAWRNVAKLRVDPRRGLEIGPGARPWQVQ